MSFMAKVSALLPTNVTVPTPSLSNLLLLNNAICTIFLSISFARQKLFFSYLLLSRAPPLEIQTSLFSLHLILSLLAEPHATQAQETSFKFVSILSVLLTARYPIPLPNQLF